MDLVDSHCHINFSPLCEDISAVMSAARENGIGHMLCVSVNAADYPEVLQLAQAHPHVFASVGIHPNKAPENEKPTRVPTNFIRILTGPRQE